MRMSCRSPGPRRLRDVLGAYVALTKPRIIELLLITTIPAMFAAQREVPAARAGAGHAGRRHPRGRQRERPELRRRRGHRRGHAADPRPPAGPARGLHPRRADLRRRARGAGRGRCCGRPRPGRPRSSRSSRSCSTSSSTRCGSSAAPSQNIVWGGLAGCMPVIIGWSAVTGGIGWPAWVFFGVIFFWTPPHTWALAMRYREDYAAAGVPMLPVVATERVVVRQIVLYSWAMVACSLLLVPASSWIYAAVAVPARAGVPGDRAPAAQPGAARRARPADDPVPPVEPVPDRRSRWPGRSTRSSGLPVLGWPW